MCLDSSPRCVRGTREKVCIYTQLYMCCFEDKKRCVAVTPYLSVQDGQVVKFTLGISVRSSRYSTFRFPKH